MKLNVNVAEAEGANNIENGTYPIIVNQAMVKQSEGKEYPYLELTLEITAGKYQGRKLVNRSSLKPTALWRLIPMLRALQALDDETDEFELDADDETGVLIEPNLIGLVGGAVTVQEVYQGRARAQVSDIIHIDDVEMPFDPDQPTIQAAIPAAAPANGATQGAVKLKL